VYNYSSDGSDATFRRLLSGTRLEHEPMSNGKMVYASWDYKTRKQMLRGKHRGMDKERRERIRLWLVVSKGKKFPCDEEEPCVTDTLKKRKSSGMVEFVSQPMKQYSGSVSGHGEGAVRSDSQSSVRVFASGNAEDQPWQTGPNSTIDRKKKKTNKSCR
jgi:hypothetical protein